MFTGLIETVGLVMSLCLSRGYGRVRILFRDKHLTMGQGDSISVDGACLTVVCCDKNGFEAEITKETISKSSLANKKYGDLVNLERAIRIGSRLGGHIVQGHIDGLGQVVCMDKFRREADVAIKVPDSLMKYVVEKGSITINGISLTVSKIGGLESIVSVVVVGYSLEHTTLSSLKAGDWVNIEVDILAKYLEKLLGKEKIHRDKDDKGLDLSFLSKHGFI